MPWVEPDRGQRSLDGRPSASRTWTPLSSYHRIIMTDADIDAPAGTLHPVGRTGDMRHTSSCRRVTVWETETAFATHQSNGGEG